MSMAIQPLESWKELKQKFYVKNIVVAAPSEPSFRLIERILVGVEQIQLHHARNLVDALADIFILKPVLVIVFSETNHDTLHLIQLIRNHPTYRVLPVIAVFHEPLTLLQKMRTNLRIKASFETPLVTANFLAEVNKICQLE